MHDVATSFFDVGILRKSSDLSDRNLSFYFGTNATNCNLGGQPFVNYPSAAVSLT